jgi:hypothetical protein
MADYPIHPACKLFPEMSVGELQALAADIKERGLLQDIVLYEGKILDGRNRNKACKIAGVKPRFVQWQGEGSPLAWVISTNLVRRHLTAGQRALIALDVLPLMAAAAKQRQQLSKGRGKKVAEKCAPLGKASAAAAKVARTNTTYVEMAKVVQATAPELIDHIRSGELTVPEARQIATLLPAQRKTALWQLRQGNQPNGRGTPFVFGSRKSKPNTIHTPAGVCQFLYDLISPVYRVKAILDPSAGESALTKPWKKRKVISFEIAAGKDFFESPEWIEADLVLCNPPFNDTSGANRYLPLLFLQRIVQVVPAGTPIAFIAPLRMRIDQAARSERWHWLRDCCPPITSVISLPYDVFPGVKVHAEILLFNMPKLRPHYFLADQYLG